MFRGFGCRGDRKMVRAGRIPLADQPRAMRVLAPAVRFDVAAGISHKFFPAHG